MSEEKLSKTVIYNPLSSIRYGEDILFVDTECDEVTNRSTFIQLRYNGKNIILEPPFDVKRIKRYWTKAKAVVMHNAPYDMAQLSKLPGNSWEWVEEINEQGKNPGTGESGVFAYWEMKLFGYTYKVKDLGQKHNLIRVKERRGTPVIDTLKLYDIFLDKDTSLKQLAPKYLKRYMIPYSPENAKTYEYLVQDVEALDGIFCRFKHEMEAIDDVKDYTLRDWMKIDSTASCSKKATLEAYPELKEWRRENDDELKRQTLGYRVDHAFLGGLTCSLYRGVVEDIAIYDIKGSYDGVINNENMDQYNKYRFEEIVAPDELPENKCPILCEVGTNKIMDHIGSSLKVFGLGERKVQTVWSYDILTNRNLFDDCDIRIRRAWKLVGLNPVKQSLAGAWNIKKDWAQDKYGKEHPLRNYFKTLSNASYGICAQRRHGRTDYTNMPKAGIITSRGRLTLSQMVKCAREHGCDWLYSDTDSVIVKLNGVDPGELENAMNKAIHPYKCECEFVGKARFLSLKRYWAYDGHDLKGNPVKDKIRVHGIGPYNVDEKDLKRMLSGEINRKPLLMKQCKASTPVTMKRVMKLNPGITDPCPFMFVKDISVGICKQDWFDKWIRHMDTKTTKPEGACYDDEFERHFPVYANYDVALTSIEESDDKLEDDNGLFFMSPKIDWDKRDEEIFGEL